MYSNNNNNKEKTVPVGADLPVPSSIRSNGTSGELLLKIGARIVKCPPLAGFAGLLFSLSERLLQNEFLIKSVY